MSKASAQKQVLLVDDDDVTLEIVKTFLEKEGYKVKSAVDAPSALNHIQEHCQQLSAIVSDVSMPKMDGYEFCRTFRETWPADKVPFIFVSANTSLEEKLEGFAAGGDDYITKPVELKELGVKLRNLIEMRDAEAILSQRLQDSQKAAFQAMSYTGQLGQILQFVQASMQDQTVKQLAKSVFAVTDALSLKCVLQFRIHETIENFSNTGTVSPLESNVVEMASKKGRIYDFNSRSIFNHDLFSLLVKNMPVDDPERYGNLKDTLCNLCNAIEARTQFLLANDQTKEKEKVLASANHSIKTVEHGLKEIHHENLLAIETMVDDVEEAMLSLGLTESQEAQMREIFKACIARTEQIFEKGESINQELGKILEFLNGR